MHRSDQVNSLFSSPTARAVAACLLSGAVSFSCNDSGRSEGAVEHIEEFDGDTTVFEGTSSLTNLTATEWETYRSDQAYVRSLVPPMTPVSLNLADERQHRFVLLRFKLAGKTPEDSPQLFKQLGEMRVQHEQLGYAAGTLAAIDAAPNGSAPHDLSSNGGNDPVSAISDNGAGRSTQHYFTSLDILPNGEDDPVAQEVLATLSALEDAYYTFVDVGAWDKNGTPLGNMDWTDAYGPMPFATVATFGNLTLATHEELEADSFVFQDLVGASPRNSYMLGPQRPGPKFEPPVITGPVDSVGGECIDICLNRVWTGDCDYDLTGTPTALKIPLAGCISFAFPSSNMYSFDQAQITDWATSGCDNDCGQIRVTLQDVGGGCNVDQANAIYGSMQQFYQNVALSNGGDTLCWDLTGANAMQFDPSCRQVQDSVELTMNLVLPWQHTSGSQGAYSFSLTNNEQSETPDFPCITVTNSCLAEGTMIELASGQPVAIEAIEAGAKASSPYGSGGLTVVDTAKGTENVPMVRIEDETGRTLLLTGKHPILVTGRGMVQAEDLKAGDSVETKTGPSRLVAVSREAFDGSVHNLKVGSDVEANGLKPDQTVVYANGFVVGDGQIQSKYESIEMAAKKKVDIRKFLPDHWMEDYRNSARRAARSKAR